MSALLTGLLLLGTPACEVLDGTTIHLRDRMPSVVAARIDFEPGGVRVMAESGETVPVEPPAEQTASPESPADSPARPATGSEPAQPSAIDRGRLIPWDQVRSIDGLEDPTLKASWPQWQAVAEDLWRARTRLQRGDRTLSAPLFEKHFERLAAAPEGSELGLIVSEGLLRSRLPSGEIESLLPAALERDQAQTVVDVEAETKRTRPPRRFSEATLLTAMETAGRSLDDDELREAMRECGLGTPATRAATIETLLTRGYIERQKKALHTTEKGLAQIDAVHPDVKSPALTGRFEAQLAEIGRGTLPLEAFMREMEQFVADRCRELRLELFEALLRDAGKQLVTIAEMAIRRCRADTGRARSFGEGETSRPLVRDQIERGLHQRFFQIAVVVTALAAAATLVPAHFAHLLM